MSTPTVSEEIFELIQFCSNRIFTTDFRQRHIYLQMETLGEVFDIFYMGLGDIFI